MTDVKTQGGAVTSSASPVKSPWIQWLLSVILVSAALAWLLLAPHHTKEVVSTAPAALSVEAVGPNEIEIDMQAPIGKKLSIQKVTDVVVTEARLKVTGSIIASRRPGKGENVDYWQFSSVDLLNTYTEHEKAVADLDFATAQLKRIQNLAKTKEEALQREIERSEKLVQSGTEAARDLAIQKTSLLETHITNERDEYEAESAIKTARRNQTAFAIQLQQAGLDQTMLANSSPDVDIVAAEVPEGKIGQVTLGQDCTARFFGLPNSKFSGKVAALAPILSSEYRTLRVLFALHDPHDELRPGMFAEIGIGVDPHPVIRIPAESVIHIGRNDYVLTVAGNSSESTSPGNPDGSGMDGDDPASGKGGRLKFRGNIVQIGNSVQGQVEVLKGLQSGEQIATGAVILLKPTLSTALERSVAVTLLEGSPQ